MIKMKGITGKTLSKGKQYYVGVSLSTQEFILPLFPYMIEHMFMENYDMQILLGMTTAGQPWYRTKLVWAGCYDEPHRFLTEEQIEKYDHYCLYDVAKAEFKKIAPERMQHLELGQMFEAGVSELLCVANHDKKEYCLLTDLPKSPIDGFRICPLPLLTAGISSTECYLGDYDNDNESQAYVGRWCGDTVSSEFSIPEGYTEIKPNFEEYIDPQTLKDFLKALAEKEERERQEKEAQGLAI